MIIGFLLGFLSLILTIYDFTMRKIVCNYYNSNFALETNQVKSRVGYGTLIKGNITNIGGEDEYKVDASVSWIVVRPSKFRLGINESVDLYIYISPVSTGNFETYLKAHSFCHSNIQKINVNSV